ncbi:ABC transporter permease [Rhodococcus pyridinivorans]|uniref:ABC transporter permease n=1 Tax=Rhodococcus pyridinivorans AK37 TaxID=1114960 RepID=H0JT86_9NOCA|nr:ABC transporter permease [Rhodococcus pyridinivorans]EHK82763.1 ABC transporter permease [Rhodococcus pyridinivorans AK37]MCD2141051.1 ABC transporter permease [Rhodococcus pyridinivorans]
MSVTIDKSTTAKTTSTESDSARPRRSLGPLFEKYALVLALIAVIVVFSALRPETYPTANNLQNILGSQAVLLVLALGLIVPLTAGEFDLSAVSTMSLAAMTIAVLNVQHGWSLLPAIAVAVLACLVVGLINALLVVRLQIDSFIATLGSGTVVLGVVQWISDSTSVTGVDSALVDATIGTRIFGVSLQFYYALALVLIMAVVFQYTPIGRRLLFVGRGAQVARLSGLHVDRIRGGALVTSALVAALAGIVYAGMLGGADPSSGQSFMLPAFAAAFLGATAIVPGRFNAFGTLVAVYFLVAGVVGLQMLGVASFVQQLFYGGALVVAVALSGAVRRRTASRSTR